MKARIDFKSRPNTTDAILALVDTYEPTTVNSCNVIDTSFIQADGNVTNKNVGVVEAYPASTGILSEKTYFFNVKITDKYGINHQTSETHPLWYYAAFSFRLFTTNVKNRKVEINMIDDTVVEDLVDNKEAIIIHPDDLDKGIGLSYYDTVDASGQNPPLPDYMVDVNSGSVVFESEVSDVVTLEYDVLSYDFGIPLDQSEYRIEAIKTSVENMYTIRIYTREDKEISVSYNTKKLTGKKRVSEVLKPVPYFTELMTNTVQSKRAMSPYYFITASGQIVTTYRGKWASMHPIFFTSKDVGNTFIHIDMGVEDSAKLWSPGFTSGSFSYPIPEPNDISMWTTGVSYQVNDIVGAYPTYHRCKVANFSDLSNGPPTGGPTYNTWWEETDSFIYRVKSLKSRRRVETAVVGRKREVLLDYNPNYSTFNEDFYGVSIYKSVPYVEGETPLQVPLTIEGIIKNRITIRDRIGERETVYVEYSHDTNIAYFDEVGGDDTDLNPLNDSDPYDIMSSLHVFWISPIGSNNLSTVNYAAIGRDEFPSLGQNDILDAMLVMINPLTTQPYMNSDDVLLGVVVLENRYRSRVAKIVDGRYRGGGLKYDVNEFDYPMNEDIWHHYDIGRWDGELFDLSNFIIFKVGNNVYNDIKNRYLEYDNEILLTDDEDEKEGISAKRAKEFINRKIEERRPIGTRFTIDYEDE